MDVCFECLRYAKFDFSLALIVRPAAEYVSWTLNVFNVNEQSGRLKHGYNTAEVQVCFECLS